MFLNLFCILCAYYNIFYHSFASATPPKKKAKMSRKNAQKTPKKAASKKLKNTKFSSKDNINSEFPALNTGLTSGDPNTTIIDLCKDDDDDFVMNTSPTSSNLKDFNGIKTTVEDGNNTSQSSVILLQEGTDIVPKRRLPLFDSTAFDFPPMFRNKAVSIKIPPPPSLSQIKKHRRPIHPRVIMNIIDTIKKERLLSAKLPGSPEHLIVSHEKSCHFSEDPSFELIDFDLFDNEDTCNKNSSFKVKEGNFNKCDKMKYINGPSTLNMNAKENTTQLNYSNNKENEVYHDNDANYSFDDHFALGNLNTVSPLASKCYANKDKITTNEQESPKFSSRFLYKLSKDSDICTSTPVCPKIKKFGFGNLTPIPEFKSNSLPSIVNESGTKTNSTNFSTSIERSKNNFLSGINKNLGRSENFQKNFKYFESNPQKPRTPPENVDFNLIDDDDDLFDDVDLDALDQNENLNDNKTAQEPKPRDESSPSLINVTNVIEMINSNETKVLIPNSPSITEKLGVDVKLPETNKLQEQQKNEKIFELNENCRTSNEIITSSGWISCNKSKVSSFSQRFISSGTNNKINKNRSKLSRLNKTPKSFDDSHSSQKSSFSISQSSQDEALSARISSVSQPNHNLVPKFDKNIISSNSFQDSPPKFSFQDSPKFPLKSDIDLNHKISTSTQDIFSGTTNANKRETLKENNRLNNATSTVNDFGDLSDDIFENLDDLIALQKEFDAKKKILEQDAKLAKDLFLSQKENFIETSYKAGKQQTIRSFIKDEEPTKKPSKLSIKKNKEASLHNEEIDDSNESILVAKRKNNNIVYSDNESSVFEENHQNTSSVVKDCEEDQRSDDSFFSADDFLPEKDDSNLNQCEPRSPSRKKKKKSGKIKSGVDLLQQEANVSMTQGVSSDESENDIDYYDPSFVNDEHHIDPTQRGVDMKAIYLKSVKSPELKRNLFKKPYNVPAIDVYSCPSSYEEAEDVEDSFVVGNDEIEYESDYDGGSTLLAQDSIVGEALNKKKKKCKKVKHKKLKKDKNRKRICRIDPSSSEEEATPLKGKNLQRSSENFQVDVIDLTLNSDDEKQTVNCKKKNVNSNESNAENSSNKQLEQHSNTIKRGLNDCKSQDDFVMPFERPKKKKKCSKDKSSGNKTNESDDDFVSPNKIDHSKPNPKKKTVSESMVSNSFILATPDLPPRKNVLTADHRISSELSDSVIKSTPCTLPPPTIPKSTNSFHNSLNAFNKNLSTSNENPKVGLANSRMNETNIFPSTSSIIATSSQNISTSSGSMVRRN